MNWMKLSKYFRYLTLTKAILALTIALIGFGATPTGEPDPEDDCGL